MKKTRRKKVRLANPAGGVEIYHRIGRIEAQKGPGHVCDPKCRKANHWYQHTFTGKTPVIGLPNGRLLI